MSEHEAFVAAIAAAPDDDTPRLVYADFLEEHGDAARAGFIRDQVRLAKLRPGSDEYRQLFRRTADTLKANLPAWIESACDAFGQPAEWKPGKSSGHSLPVVLESRVPTQALAQVTFERGFPEQPWIRLSELGDGSPLGRLLRTAPISRLFLQLGSPEAQLYLPVDELKQIRSVAVHGPFRAAHAEMIFRLSSWPSLRRLTVGESASALVTYLTGSPAVKQLHGLRVAFTNSVLSDLACFPLDDAIRDLALYPGSSRPDREHLTRMIANLAAIAFRPTLKRLDLTGCTIGDRGLAALARAEVWVRLRALVLDRNRFGDPGWRDFVRSRRTPELTLLSASRNFVTGDGAARLAQSPLAATLQYVDLRGNRIDGKGAVALARGFGDGPLKKLLLAGNPIPPRDAETVRKILGERVEV